MRAGAKMLMISSRRGSGGQNEMRNEMRGGSGGRNEMRGGYGAQNEMRGEYSPRNEMRYEMGGDQNEMRRGSGGRNEMRDGYGGQSEMRYEMGGEQNEMRGEMRRGSGGRNEYGNMRGGEMRRGSGGRSEYEEMRDGYGEMRGEEMRGYGEMGGDEMESRFRDRRGREHYDNGRFAPMRNEMQMGEGGDPFYPTMPPIRQEHTNPIGFSSESKSNVVPFRMDEHSHKKFTKEMAEEWTSKMENEDGTRGPHWSMEQIKQVMAQKNIELDPIEFYLAMNMMYSDYCKVAKKLNVNNSEFYANMAKAFLEDKDAGGSDKLMRYYKYVVM